MAVAFILYEAWMVDPGEKLDYAATGVALDENTAKRWVSEGGEIENPEWWPRPEHQIYNTRKKRFLPRRLYREVPLH